MDGGGNGQRMADYLRQHQDKVIGRWSELVTNGVRGRITAEEVRRELSDLYALLIRVLSDADDHAAGPRRLAKETDNRCTGGPSHRSVLSELIVRRHRAGRLPGC